MAFVMKNPFFRGTAANPAGATLTNDRYFSPAQNAKNWRWAFFGLLLAVVGLVGALVYVISREQVRVFAVKVDEFGETRVEELQANAPHAPEVMQRELVSWVKDIRTVTTDQAASVRRMNEAFGMATEPVQRMIAEYYHQNPIEEIIKKGTRHPVNVRVSYVAGKTWQLKWKEQVMDQGRVIGQEDWEGTMEVEVVEPKNSTERKRSPLGVWIMQVQWSPV